MSDVTRKRSFVEATGVMLDPATGEYSEQTVRLDGRFKTAESAERSVRRRFTDFLPKNVVLREEEYTMPEEEFYRRARRIDDGDGKKTKKTK